MKFSASKEDTKCLILVEGSSMTRNFRAANIFWSIEDFLIYRFWESKKVHYAVLTLIMQINKLQHGY